MLSPGPTQVPRPGHTSPPPTPPQPPPHDVPYPHDRPYPDGRPHPDDKAIHVNEPFQVRTLLDGPFQDRSLPANAPFQEDAPFQDEAPFQDGGPFDGGQRDGSVEQSFSSNGLPSRSAVRSGDGPYPGDGGYPGSRTYPGAPSGGGTQPGPAGQLYPGYLPQPPPAAQPEPHHQQSYPDYLPVPNGHRRSPGGQPDGLQSVGGEPADTQGILMSGAGRWRSRGAPSDPLADPPGHHLPVAHRDARHPLTGPGGGRHRHRAAAAPRQDHPAPRQDQEAPRDRSGPGSSHAAPGSPASGAYPPYPDDRPARRADTHSPRGAWSDDRDHAWQPGPPNPGHQSAAASLPVTAYHPGLDHRPEPAYTESTAYSDPDAAYGDRVADHRDGLPDTGDDVSAYGEADPLHSTSSSGGGADHAELAAYPEQQAFQDQPGHQIPTGPRPDADQPRLASALLPAPPQTASRGWRKLIYQVSAGAVNPGPSANEVRDRRLEARIRTPLRDCHRIAVLSLKGRVGKTTVTVAVGSTLASLRGDRVVAIDANPDRGTLSSKVQRTSPHTVRELLADAPHLHRYMDVSKYLSQADSRLEVLASTNDPELSDSFGEPEYRAVDDLLQRHYSILLTDCGTSILHSAMHGVLEMADTLVIVSSATTDGGSSASATLDWLEAHGYAAQVREAVAVISMFPATTHRVDVSRLTRHFEGRTRRVIQVPFDPHLAAGGRIVLADLRRETRDAYREIAGAVAERFGQEAGRG
ncbi:ATPase involved in chromosome partitioning [Frankia sp. AiPs1]